MDSIYLISSPDDYIINDKLNKILKKEDKSEIIYYDLEEVSIDKVIEELDTYNFFNNRKVVVCKNSYFLSSEKNKSNVEHNVELLEKYINNPNTDNLLILTCNSLDGKKKIVKLLKEKAKVEILEEINIINEINKNKDDYKIDNQTINYLVDYLNHDNYRIINELNKLKLFKYDEKEITIKDIDCFVTKNIDDNIFLLGDYIINKDKKNALEIYNDLILKNEDPINIMMMVASKFRLLYQVKVLSKSIYSPDEIAKILGSHPYPVKLAKKVIYKYSEEELLNILYKLACLDYDIKSGNSYNNIGFELLILSL